VQKTAVALPIDGFEDTYSHLMLITDEEGAIKDQIILSSDFGRALTSEVR